jgi:tripartite-type tricarboxylate transporter receptor subunit TctC
MAIATEKRLEAAPDIPTVAESYPGFSFSSLNGFFARAETPEDIVTELRSAVTEICDLAGGLESSQESRHRSRWFEPGTDARYAQER